MPGKWGGIQPWDPYYFVHTALTSEWSALKRYYIQLQQRQGPWTALMICLAYICCFLLGRYKKKVRGIGTNARAAARKTKAYRHKKGYQRVLYKIPRSLEYNFNIFSHIYLTSKDRNLRWSNRPDPCRSGSRKVPCLPQRKSRAPALTYTSLEVCFSWVVHTVFFSVFLQRYTLYVVHWMHCICCTILLNTLYCTLYAVYMVHYIQWTVNCTNWVVRWIHCIVHCIIRCITHRILHRIQYTVLDMTLAFMHDLLS